MRRSSGIDARDKPASSATSRSASHCVIAALFSALSTARFASASKASSLAPTVPLRMSSMSGAMPPAEAIATLLSGLTARFRSAFAA